MDNEFIANTLLQLATYGKVCFAQRDVRWQKTIQAYRDFCIASGIEPVMIPAGTDGSRVESKMKMPSSWTAEEVANCC